MTSINVRVLNKDNKFGGRNIDVSFGSTSFTTPNRSATQKEYHGASSLPHEKVIIKNPVSEFVSDFNGPTLEAFLNDNGSFKNRRKKIDQATDMMRYFPIMSTVQFPKETRIPKDYLMLFDAFQKDKQFDIVSIPPFEYVNIEEYQQEITKYCERAKSRRQIGMPILPLTTEIDKFRDEFRVLRELHESGLCDVIGFGYANPSLYPIQMMEVYLNREFKIWYHCFGTPRTPRGKNATPVAHIHEMQNWGFDTFSPRVTTLGMKQIRFLIMKSKTTSPSEVECQRYDSPTLGIMKEKEWISRYRHDLHCNCPVCRGKDLASFKEDYSHELDGSFNSNLLRDADKVHELFSGSNEFSVSKDAIRSDDLPAYFGGKEFTRGRVKPPKKSDE